jgi:tRNA(Ser,Leu) C12 N-acetylase TAN1
MGTFLDWNVLVTSRDRGEREVLRALAPLVKLRRSGFRNVLLGRVDDPEAFLAAVEVQRERQPFLESSLARILPIERTFAVEVPRFEETLRAEAAPFIDRLAGRSFHVRVERRGHKGLIHSQAAEQALSAHLYETLEARGAAPVVDFEDPDAVVAVELVGDVAGIALVTRELRRRFTFVRID